MAMFLITIFLKLTTAFVVISSLKKTSTVLDEHEEALRKKLEMVSLERQTHL